MHVARRNYKKNIENIKMKKIKNIIHNLPKWAKLLIAFIVSIIVQCALPFLVLTIFPSSVEPDSDLNIFFVFAVIIPSIVSMVLLVAFLVSIVRWSSDKITSYYEDAKPVTYSEIEYSGDVDEKKYQTPTKNYSYNTGNSFSRSVSNQSWSQVIGFMVVLFPVGIYYMIRKIHSERDRYYHNGVKLILIGSVFSILTIPGVIFYLANDVAPVALLPGIYLLTGLIMIIIGVIILKIGKTEVEVMKIITNDCITNLDSISSRIKRSYSDVVNTIEDLIDSGELSGTYIYHHDREVIVPGISKKVAHKCNNCGGTTVYYSNEITYCEYCGSKI